MTGPVLVTGAAGVLGSAVMSRLAAKGIAARGMTRREPPGHGSGSWVRADLGSGEGLSDALQGAAAVIHCASEFGSDGDLAAIDRLVAASKAAGGVRIVNAGIAGIDQAGAYLPYYAIKLVVEQKLAASGVPHAIVRATQFHPFVDFLIGQCDDGTVLRLPSDVTLQPVALEFVADRLIECAGSRQEGRFPDVHGPDTLTMVQLAEAWLAARALRRVIEQSPATDGVFLGFSKLQRAEMPGGGESWQQWLAANAGRENPYARRFGSA